jgi:para-nitrobenzyl esterase
VHSAEIEYALGNLDSNPVYAWTADDRRVSEAMQGYFAAFVAGGDPNRPGLPRWPPAGGGESAAGGKVGEAAMVLRIDVEPRAEVERHRERYLLLDRLNGTAEPDLEKPVAPEPAPDRPGDHGDR